MAEPCALWVLLLRKFALGKLSAIEVQELAAAAVKSGLDRTEIRELQSLGAMGHQPGNAHRDMLRKHFAVLASPEPWKVKCDLVLKEDGKPVEKELETAVMLPHLWVLCAQENELLHSITCTNEELAVFWKSQMKSPQMTQELKRMIEASEPSQLPIPHVLHGDGAPFTEVDSVQVLSFRCLLARRSVSECQLLITAVPKLAMAQATFKQVMASVAWSWKALFDGVCPKKDWQGKPIELHKGRRLRRGVLWSITGDLEWFCQEFGFPWASSNLLCPYCEADQMKKGSKHSFTDFRPAASWRKTVFSKEDLKAKFANHPLWKAPGVSILSVRLDWLHTVDLGVAAYLHGSLLYSIMEELPGTSRFLENQSKFFILLFCHCLWAGQPRSFTSIVLGWKALGNYERTIIYTLPRTSKTHPAQQEDN